MGDVKENMKASVSAKDVDLTKKSINPFKGLMSKKAVEEPKVASSTFADLIMSADNKMDQLIKSKTSDLNTETGSEVYNRQALAHLKVMRFHLDEICNLAESYSNISK